MSADTKTQRAGRGRPRSEKASAAILRAADELLLTKGLEAVSMDAVAERAGVSKATIYRWWPTKEALALDALYQEWAAHAAKVRDTGSLRGDLLALLRAWARLVSRGPYAKVVAALILRARSDPKFAKEYLARLVTPRREAACTILLRAIDRSELPADCDVELALDLLYGPLYLRLLQQHAPLNDTFVRAVVDAALAALIPQG